MLYILKIYFVCSEMWFVQRIEYYVFRTVLHITSRLSFLCSYCNNLVYSETSVLGGKEVTTHYKNLVLSSSSPKLLYDTLLLQQLHTILMVIVFWLTICCAVLRNCTLKCVTKGFSGTKLTYAWLIHLDCLSPVLNCLQWM